ncbi:MAG: sterol carrier protein [Haloarculaceae archaeon]
MTPTLPDEAEAWATRWRSRLNESENFELAAADLTVTVGCVIEPDADYTGEPIALRAIVEDGACTEVERAEADDPADVTLRGGYGAWKKLLRDDLDVAMALTDGTFEADGDRLLLLQHRAAVAELVRAAREVETTFEY